MLNIQSLRPGAPACRQAEEDDVDGFEGDAKIKLKGHILNGMEIRLEFSKGTLPMVDTRFHNSSGSFGLLGWFLTLCTLAHFSHFRHFYRVSPLLTEIMICINMCI